ncbi:MAG: Holliday junction branch migration protein RuvA [Bacteroidales bacterium]
MYEYIEGSLTEISPTHLVVETTGMAYYIQISLYSYSRFTEEDLTGKKVKVYLHHIVREDAQLLYGFYDRRERQIFRQLISVSGVGAGTARMILSAHRPAEIEKAIMQADVNLLKNIKGIGIKSAQRIIVDLKGKIGKDADAGEIFAAASNTRREEALSALVTLGFPKVAAGKVIDSILAENPEGNIEELIKLALKRL